MLSLLPSHWPKINFSIKLEFISWQAEKNVLFMLALYEVKL